MRYARLPSQVAADAMPGIAKFAPARVARELDYLRGSFRSALDEGQDGLVRTFATLCIASVAYQKRLEPVLTDALGIAEGKTLSELGRAIAKEIATRRQEIDVLARALVESGMAVWQDQGETTERLIVRGRSNLLADAEAQDLERIRTLFDDLERKRDILMH